MAGVPASRRLAGVDLQVEKARGKMHQSRKQTVSYNAGHRESYLDRIRSSLVTANALEDMLSCFAPLLSVCFSPCTTSRPEIFKK
jgi:hypothetical protein